MLRRKIQHLGSRDPISLCLIIVSDLNKRIYINGTHYINDNRATAYFTRWCMVISIASFAASITMATFAASGTLRSPTSPTAGRTRDSSRKSASIPFMNNILLSAEVRFFLYVSNLSRYLVFDIDIDSIVTASFLLDSLSIFNFGSTSRHCEDACPPDT